VLRIFGLSFVVTAAALVVAFGYGAMTGGVSKGLAALSLCAILGVLEVSLSFDNAVVNASVLQKLSDYWQKVFLTVGVLIAAFGMRFILPMAVVWVTAGLNPAEALKLALHPPAHHAATFPDGSPSYETYLHHAHPLIAAFGGVFLLMLFLSFILEERELTWLSWVERPLAKLGRLDQLRAVITMSVVLVITYTVVTPAERVAVLTAAALGLVSYILVDGLGAAFEAEEEEQTAGSVVKLVGRAAFFTFLYLEVLDASFSFDGVMGAFAITADPILILLGLGFIGAMFVRSLTVFLVRKGTLAEYVYLEHGAHWAIGTLSIIMLISIGVDVNDVLTGLVGVVLIGAAFASSIIRKRREPDDQLVMDEAAAFLELNRQTSKS
jgi:uncharacterized protein